MKKLCFLAGLATVILGSVSTKTKAMELSEHNNPHDFQQYCEMCENNNWNENLMYIIEEKRKIDNYIDNSKLIINQNMHLNRLNNIINKMKKALVKFNSTKNFKYCDLLTNLYVMKSNYTKNIYNMFDLPNGYFSDDYSSANTPEISE